jgi:hypothetical protein
VGEVLGGPWCASVFLSIIIQCRSAIFEFLAPQTILFSLKRFGRKHSTNLRWISLWLPPSACKYLTAARTSDLEKCSITPSILFAYKADTLKLNNPTTLPTNAIAADLGDLVHLRRSTLPVLSRSSTLYVTYVYMQITSRCRAQAMYNKHLLPLISEHLRSS